MSNGKRNRKRKLRLSNSGCSIRTSSGAPYRCDNSKPPPLKAVIYLLTKPTKQNPGGLHKKGKAFGTEICYNPRDIDSCGDYEEIEELVELVSNELNSL
jgi:hypothetical protein